MKKQSRLSSLIILSALFVSTLFWRAGEGEVLAQTSILSTNPVAHDILLGNYTPSAYFPSTVINQHSPIVQGISNEINSDSLKSYMIQLAAFHNRSTGADTSSNSIGIGAARRWARDKFSEFSVINQNRLIPSFLQFDQQICNVYQHRNIFAVLPGMQNTDKSCVIIEAHIDSRCEVDCDSLCQAQGMEDNATGCALVLELARVMSKYAFNNTIVFLLTIGEEQGLMGAEAFALYCEQNSITVKCVQNNDVIGGIICGATSSPPSCPGVDQIDSTHVRIFSYGSYTSPHKAFARFSKLEYLDEAFQFANVPMAISVMTPEDRTGRGGDHIPFRSHNFTAIRFTAANEHGNANVADINYTDRQHSFRDILGVDTDANGSIDSFYVDFNYLKRNTIINGTAAAMAAIGPMMPAFTFTNDSSGIKITVSAQTQYAKYAVHVRRIASNYDLDLLYYFTGTLTYDIPGIKKDSTYYVSIASVDTSDVESLFSIEQKIKANGDGPLIISETTYNGKFQLEIVPNPSRGITSVRLLSSFPCPVQVQLIDILGREVMHKSALLSYGENEIPFEVIAPPGVYNLNVYSQNKFVTSKRMVVIK